MLRSDVANVPLEVSPAFLLYIILVHPQCGIFVFLGLCRT